MCRQLSNARREFQFLAIGKESGRGRKSVQLKKLLVHSVFERKGEASDAEAGAASMEVGTEFDRIQCREVRFGISLKCRMVCRKFGYRSARAG
jgi:hypothetical protein